jgi:hypothetical protein
MFQGLVCHRDQGQSSRPKVTHGRPPSWVLPPLSYSREVGPADILVYVVSGTHLCNYSLVGCDVAHVCR